MTAAFELPASSATMKVVRGNPDETELAVVIALFAALSGPPEDGGPAAAGSPGEVVPIAPWARRRHQLGYGSPAAWTFPMAA